MKPFKEVIDGIRKAVMASEVREDLAQMGEYVEQFANTAGENIKKAIDPTLSLSGKAADAKATGDALKEEAERAKAADQANAESISTEASAPRARSSAWTLPSPPKPPARNRQSKRWTRAPQLSNPADLSWLKAKSA